MNDSINNILCLLERIDHQYREYSLLTEGAESRNMSAAKHYLYDRMGYDEREAMNFIGKVKTDIPNSRLAKCKFMLGLVRMVCDNELTNANTILGINTTLKYVASDAHVNEYDQNLNNMHAEELIQRFSTARTQDIERDRQEVGSMQYDNNSNYDIVRINSFEEATKYGGYTDWCVTHYNNMYDSYTAGGLNVFYFCLRKDYENVEAVQGENCPLDEYGLSMIAVSVCPDGSMNTCTCRWNHENGGNDSIMDTKQLSQVLGVNYYSVFKPISPEETRQRLINAIENGGSDLSNVVKGDFVIPNGVRNIGDFAFSNCENLTSITIPDSVTRIGAIAFSGCTGLTSVTIPNSVTSIGSSAFSGCTNLESITITNSVRSIGEYAFYYCSSLTSITIPDSVTKIGNDAFRYCYSLTSITIPNSVREIGECAFYSCRSLASIIIGNGVRSIGDNAFLDCTSLTSITIPNSVREIGDFAFSNCDNLTIYVFSEKEAQLVRNSDFNGRIEYISAQNTVSESLNRLYENSSSNDITNDLKRYFQLCQLSDFGDANSSIEASRLHEKLMESLLLFHQNTNDRKIFARILSYMRNLFATKMDIKVTTNDNYEWYVEMDANDGSYNLDNTVTISSYDVENNEAFDEIVYRTHDGVIWEETEATTDYNGRAVFDFLHARMSDEMKQKIYSMGLIPGIIHWGSYHEDFVECVGVLPSMKKEAEKRGVNFKCYF